MRTLIERLDVVRLEEGQSKAKAIEMTILHMMYTMVAQNKVPAKMKLSMIVAWLDEGGGPGASAKESSIRATIGRLVKRGDVSKDGDRYSLTVQGTKAMRKNRGY